MLAKLAHHLDTAAFLQSDVGDDNVRLNANDRIHGFLLAFRETDDVKITQALTFSIMRLRMSDESSTTKTRTLVPMDESTVDHQFIKLWRSAYAVRSALRVKSIFSKMRLL